MSNVQKRVERILVEHLGIADTKLTPSARFIDDLGADSLDVVEIVMALEEEFAIEIGDEDAEQLTTVGKLYQYIESRVAKEV